MPWEALLTLVVVSGMVVILAREMAPPAFAVLGADLLLMLTGVISDKDALAGFGNAATLTVAALYVLAGAVRKTGALQPLVDKALSGGRTPQRSLVRLLLPVSGASAFLNNTPIVAVVVAQVANWANRSDQPPSRYLMPIAYGVSFGGMITLIGTSSNVAVSGVLESQGMPAMGMFEITPIGLPVAIVGVLALIALSPRLLADRRSARQEFTERAREFLVSMRVHPGGPLDGVTVEAGGLRHLQGVYLAEIDRGDQLVAPVAPTETLFGGDRLTFVGRADQVRDLHLIPGLVSAAHKHLAGFEEGAGHTFFEAVVSPISALVGKTLKEVGFRAHYQAVVVGLHRAGERVGGKLGEVPLRPGDTLMLLSDPEFAGRWRDTGEFLLVASLGGALQPPTRHAIIVGVVTLAVVVIAGTGLLPMLQVALLAALALVAFRVLTVREARDAIDLDVIAMIAASFGVAAAIEQSGLAGLIGAGIVETFSRVGAPGILLGVVVAEILLTQVITNTAAAVLLFPIAVATAASAGIDPRPFVLCLTVAASAAFATPIGYQTNLMIYGPGGYRFSDYVRLGIPLLVITAAAIVGAAVMWWGPTLGG
jgi:di/tricarboxylate transporter